MPKNLQKSARGAERKSRKNDRVEAEAIDDPDVLFGRTIKHLGHGQFTIVVQEPGHREHLIEVIAKVVDKNTVRIAINDLVIVVKSGKTFELKGRLSAKSAKKLRNDKKIQTALLQESTGGEDEEDIFSSGDEADPVAEEEIDVDKI
jgi:hypothetical protein